MSQSLSELGEVAKAFMPSRAALNLERQKFGMPAKYGMLAPLRKKRAAKKLKPVPAGSPFDPNVIHMNTRNVPNPFDKIR